MLGLRSSDVDFDAGTLAVRRTLLEMNTGYIFETPKNGKRGNVRLTGGAIEALKRHHAT